MPYRAAVVAFTAHSILATGLPEDEVWAHLPDADLGAPMAAAFLAWLGKALESTPGTVDVVLVHLGPTRSSMELVPEINDYDHPRAKRARQQRRQVQTYADAQKQGIVMLGRGLVDRWEISLELAPAARGHGLGRAIITAARALIPADEPVFAQVSPGNAQSLRAFLASGFRPIGSEVLFH
jgi:RimJ/RimL family protein N-acetyltransferase